MRRAIIDRFEEERAVLTVDGRQEVLPRATLPPGAEEGDVLDLDAMEVDRAATEELRSKVRAERARAFQGKKLPPGEL
ncbi:MAG: DUF3006 domain-containing protein [Myxococcales bacterium]|nr:DUF3006 domain-containing protein [Myxococcales bacterium]